MSWFDILIYPPPPLQAQLNQSKTSFGGVLTLVIPVVLSVYFAIVFTNNAKLPDVSPPPMIPDFHDVAVIVCVPWGHPCHGTDC